MGNVERTKKRALIWKRAIAHFSICFVMGFFTGFFPTSNHNYNITSNFNHYQDFPPRPIEPSIPRPSSDEDAGLQRVRLSETKQEQQRETNLNPRKLVIIVTPMSSRERFRSVLLTRLGNTLDLVRPPLLWIVVEGQTEEAGGANEMLRKTKVMYRHLVSKENFTDPEAELDHQRNVALKHIELHRLSGIVHFSGLSNVYDLEFFDELRNIEAFGTWPMALLSANRNKVAIEGPVCHSSQFFGWHLRNLTNNNNNNETEFDSKPPIHISSFGFNSSILWDPERWGRTSLLQTTSQSSINFVKQVVLEDETEMKGIPEDGCSKIMLWRLQFPYQDIPINLINQYVPTSVNGNNQR